MTQRVSPPRVFGGAGHAGKPPIGAAGSADSFRQLGFVLGDDVDLVIEALELESMLAEGAAGAKFRNQVVASTLAFWSRSWLTRLQALHAIEWGNYTAALPLVRASADFQSAQLAMLRSGAEEWIEWLDAGAISLAPAEHATSIELHAFRSAETMAVHAVLGPVYRIATDLSLPHFGSTLLSAAPDSDATRVAVTFGDRDFHVGWAELSLGLLMQLGQAQLDALIEFADVLGIADTATVHTLSQRLERAGQRPGRCAVSIVEISGSPRYLISNWRRNPSGAPLKILL